MNTDTSAEQSDRIILGTVPDATKVAKHGGDVNHPDGGATVRLEMPLNTSADAPSGAAA